MLRAAMVLDAHLHRFCPGVAEALFLLMVFTCVRCFLIGLWERLEAPPEATAFLSRSSNLITNVIASERRSPARSFVYCCCSVLFSSFNVVTVQLFVCRLAGCLSIVAY